MLSIKIHESYRKVVAVCDSELIGKKFEEGNKQLDVKESFYEGEKVDGEKAIEMIKGLSLDDATFNIVGEKAVQMALESGIINEEGIGKVDKVPFALVLL